MGLGEPKLVPTSYKLSVDTRARIERIRQAWCLANQVGFIRQHYTATDVIRGLVNREITQLDKNKEIEDAKKSPIFNLEELKKEPKPKAKAKPKEAKKYFPPPTVEKKKKARI
jgi:hypothetical protein